MQKEIEVKFLGVDHDAVRESLKNAGAECEQPMRLMRRAVFDWPDALQKPEDSFMRVRDEGHKITMTYKVFNEITVDGAHEVEIVIDDFERGVALLEAIGLPLKSEQESKRETWKLGDVEIVLDEWPWIRPYTEIEGPSEDAIKEVAKTLGFDWNKAVFGPVTLAYRAEYDIPKRVSVGENPRIAFDEPVPEKLQKLRRTDVEI